MDLGADEPFENGKLLIFGTAEVNPPSEDLVSPRSDLADTQLVGRGIMSHDEDILTLNVDGERRLKKRWNARLRTKTVPDAERVRTISNPAQPSKKEREEHEATHAQQSHA